MLTAAVAMSAAAVAAARWPDHVRAVSERNVSKLGPNTSWPYTGFTARWGQIW